MIQTRRYSFLKMFSFLINWKYSRKEEFMYYNRVIKHVRELTPEEFRAEIYDGSFAENILAKSQTVFSFDKIINFFKK